MARCVLSQAPQGIQGPFQVPFRHGIGQFEDERLPRIGHRGRHVFRTDPVSPGEEGCVLQGHLEDSQLPSSEFQEEGRGFG